MGGWKVGCVIHGRLDRTKKEGECGVQVGGGQLNGCANV